MLDLPRQIRSAAGDYFMHAQDRRMRQAGLAGNVCRIAVKLDGGLNPELLAHRVAASPLLDWLARVRIIRPLAVFPAVWRATAQSRPLLHQHNGQPGAGGGQESLPPAVLGRELHASRGPALALDLAPCPDGTKLLVLSWNHALMDARGAELILRHLSADSAAMAGPAVEDLINPEQRRWRLAEWWRKLKLARGSLKWLHESGREPLFTLLPAGRAAGPIRNLRRSVAFSAPEAARLNARCQRLDVGFRRSHFYLAAVVRAVHSVAVRRGNTEGAYLVPVPHDMRRRGANGPIFSNHLSILFYRLEPRAAASMSAAIGELTRQMMDQIRDRFPESCMAALDMFKLMPLDYYVRHLGKPTRGKFATFCFSDSGESCAGISELAGARIQEVTHWVPTWRPPGLTVLFWSFSGRPCALLSWMDDCLCPAEVDRLERELRAALLDEDVT